MFPAAAPFAYREHHAALGSTNDRAMTLAARPDVPLPVLVTATRQTRGRGRHGKIWESRPGDVIATVLFEIDRPDPAVGLARASVGAGLCLLEAVAERLPGLADRLALKWPNDVWLDGRKLAGVLVESRPTAGRTRLAVGFGLNAAGGSGRREDAASVTAEAEDLRVAIGGRIVAALPGPIAWGLPEERLAEVDALRGRRISIESGGKKLTGFVSGMTPGGGLRVAAESGAITVSDGSPVCIDG